MNRRFLILASTSMWLGLLLGASMPAIAKDGDSGSEDNSGHGGGDDGGGSGGDDNSGHGNADDRGDDNGADGGSATDSQASGGDGHGGDPMPLRQMLEIFAGYGAVTVVDVGLVRRGGGPQYKFRYIDGQGRVRNAYFDALTGEQAR